MWYPPIATLVAAFGRVSWVGVSEQPRAPSTALILRKEGARYIFFDYAVWETLAVGQNSEKIKYGENHERTMRSFSIAEKNHYKMVASAKKNSQKFTGALNYDHLDVRSTM